MSSHSRPVGGRAVEGPEQYKPKTKVSTKMVMMPETFLMYLFFETSVPADLDILTCYIRYRESFILSSVAYLV